MEHVITGSKTVIHCKYCIPSTTVNLGFFVVDVLFSLFTRFYKEACKHVTLSKTAHGDLNVIVQLKRLILERVMFLIINISVCKMHVKCRECSFFFSFTSLLNTGFLYIKGSSFKAYIIVHF